MRGGTKYTITIDRHRISHGITICMTMASCPLPHMSNGHRPRYHHNPDASTASLGDKRIGSVKKMRKEKCRRKLVARRARRLADDDTVRIERTHRAGSFAIRAGFLLLVHEDGALLNGCEDLRGLRDNDGDAAAGCCGQKVKASRVFARLHPSGWLSVEDRSIHHCRDRRGNESTTRQQQWGHARPLPPRMRYLDIYIDPDMTCIPLIRDGGRHFTFG